MAEPVKNTPVLAGKQMSASLKERLKRAGRSYTSPCVKKLKVDLPPNAENVDQDQAGQYLKENSTNSAPCVHNDIVAKSDRSPEDQVLCSKHTSSGQKAADNACTENPTEPKSIKGSNSTKSALHCGLISTPASSKTGARFSSSVSNIGDSFCTGTSDSLTNQCKEMKRKIKLKEEKLRKLKLVKVHNSKNDLDKLDELTQKWKRASQMALEQLQQLATTEPKPTLTQLVDHFSLDHELLSYNAEEETFS